MRKLTMRERVCLLLVLVLLLSFPLGGCGGGSGGGGSASGGGVGSAGSSAPSGATVQGLITDKTSNEPLSDVTVTVGGTNTASDSQGRYSLRGVPAGKQKITTSSRGYYDESAIITVSDGETVKKDMALAGIPKLELSAATSYKWQVEAVDNSGLSAMGPEWTFTTASTSTAGMKAVREPVSADTARKIAEVFLGREGRAGYAIDSMRTLDDSGSSLAFVFSLRPCGYVVVPCNASELVPPVIACSFTTPFPWDDRLNGILPSLLKKDIKLRAEALSKGLKSDAESSFRNVRMWRDYMSGESVRRVKAQTGPLMEFHTWSQGWPFNTKCPVDPATGKNYEVGCVALSMAQIFCYWQSPTSLAFTSADSYTTRTEHLAVDASAAGFSGLDYRNGSPDNDAKAALSFACGVLVQMDYSSSGSFAFPEAAQQALAGRCGFKNAKLQRSEGIAAFNTSNIISSLQKSAPCMLSVNSEAQGHEIICDGYDPEGPLFHLNFGWNGVSDGWYDIPKGMPGGYSVVDSVIYDIYLDDPAYVKPSIPRNPSPSDASSNVSVDVDLTWDECANNSYYNIYVWPASEQKPAQPQVERLTVSSY